jgi:hypothetical protein
LVSVEIRTIYVHFLTGGLARTLLILLRLLLLLPGANAPPRRQSAMQGILLLA